MSKYFFDFRPDFNLFNPDTKRATTIYYTVVYFICSMVYDGLSMEIVAIKNKKNMFKRF